MGFAAANLDSGRDHEAIEQRRQDSAGGIARHVAINAMPFSWIHMRPDQILGRLFPAPRMLGKASYALRQPKADLQI